jgi:signal transduction histidine kinase
MSLSDPVPSVSTWTLPLELRRWRVTTAARVFTLAAALGLAGSTATLPESATAFLALCSLAAVMSVFLLSEAMDWRGPIAEGALAALILGTAGSPAADPLLVYLAVPPLIAGLGFGSLLALITVLSQAAVQAGASFASQEGWEVTAHLQAIAPFLLGGLGLGLLGAWMRSSARQQEALQAPYAAAHRLLTQLRGVSRRLAGGLDTPTLAQVMLTATERHLHATRTALLLGADESSLSVLATRGQPWDGQRIEHDPLVAESWRSGSPRSASLGAEPSLDPVRTVVPARVGDRLIGMLVAECPVEATNARLEALQAEIDDQSLRLETALLFDEVRSLATAEERNRLGREIHDGIAQEIASLGYLVDDIAASDAQPHTRAAALKVREELSRMVGELRLSIFDLRHGIGEQAGLGRALADYVHEVGTKTDMRVHLSLHERPGRLRIEVETELLRLAQEAITNARKHSGARNLWVRLETDAPSVELWVEDDGVGGAGIKPDHYGLRIMRERAERIGAALTITESHGGGTVVHASISGSQLLPEGADIDHHYGHAR